MIRISTNTVSSTSTVSRAVAVAVLTLLGASMATAQTVTQPPSGDNQKASVIQHIGLVQVRIDYSSPDVTGTSGEDRTGKIWGQLVPYGMANLGFGSCGDQCPWRAGANENTVFTVSHDVQIEGEPLAAGSYGLHMIPGEEEWTVIFSNNTTSWGSFFYDAGEDALRVTVKSREHEFTHWLTYEFIDRDPDQATVALRWENLEVPWTISVPDTVDLWIANMRGELRSTAGFTWQGWQQAAQYCLQNNVNLEEALQWAEQAVSLPGIGQENFTTLSTLAQAQTLNGKTDESQKTLAKAIDHPSANPFGIHVLGRQMIAQGRPEKAMEIFETNAKKHPDAWPVHVGLARGYSALGKYEKALEEAKIALEQAPNAFSKQNMEGLIAQLEKGEDIN